MQEKKPTRNLRVYLLMLITAFFGDTNTSYAWPRALSEVESQLYQLNTPSGKTITCVAEELGSSAVLIRGTKVNLVKNRIIKTRTALLKKRTTDHYQKRLLRRLKNLRQQQRTCRNDPRSPRSNSEPTPNPSPAMTIGGGATQTAAPTTSSTRSPSSTSTPGVTPSAVPSIATTATRTPTPTTTRTPTSTATRTATPSATRTNTPSVTFTPGSGFQCGGRQYQSGLCCNGIWFDPSYPSCPTGTYRFVAVDGNDSNSGAESAPLRTVRRAADLAVAGDVVIVKQGTYLTAGGNYFTPALNPANSGTSDRPIIFRSFPGHSVTLNANTAVIGSYLRHNVVWDGFIVSNTCNCKETPIPIYGANGVTIRNCEIIGQYDSSGDNHAGIFLNSTNGVTIANNRIHGFQGPDGHSDGILTYFVYDTLIENNEIWDSFVGISLKGGPSDRSILRKNLIHDITVGIWIINQSSQWSRIHQNIVTDCREGMFMNPHRDESIRNFDVYNNVFNRCSEEGINGWANADQTPPSIAGFHFWNNIYSQVTWPYRLDIYNEDPRNAFLADHNNYYMAQQFFAARSAYNSLTAWQQGTGKDQGSTSHNPLFVSSNDFHLSPVSSLLGAGIDRQDHDGDLNFNEPINLGPYITGNEVIGTISYQ